MKTGTVYGTETELTQAQTEGLAAPIWPWELPPVGIWVDGDLRGRYTGERIQEIAEDWAGMDPSLRQTTSIMTMLVTKPRVFYQI